MKRRNRPPAKFLVVALLLFMVVLIAAPIGPLVPIEAFLQPKLAWLGIDVSNTPLTADMMMMYDKRYRKSLYRSELTVLFRRREGLEAVEWRDLPFYGWRVPSILFIENVYWGYPVRGEIHALCHTLTRLRGEGDAFFVRTDLPGDIAGALGLNRWIPCL